MNHRPLPSPALSSASRKLYFRRVQSSTQGCLSTWSPSVAMVSAQGEQGRQHASSWFPAVETLPRERTVERCGAPCLYPAPTCRAETLHKPSQARNTVPRSLLPQLAPRVDASCWDGQEQKTQDYRPHPASPL